MTEARIKSDRSQSKPKYKTLQQQVVARRQFRVAAEVARRGPKRVLFVQTEYNPLDE